MNGRVYDPSIGRFLSADPHIQAPLNSQSYNRYTYVLNNPLKYTDPSGYFFKKEYIKGSVSFKLIVEYEKDNLNFSSLSQYIKTCYKMLERYYLILPVELRLLQTYADHGKKLIDAIESNTPIPIEDHGWDLKIPKL